MKKWKYEIIYNCAEENLNDMGQDGWELITVYKEHPENMHTKFVFKKEIL